MRKRPIVRPEAVDLETPGLRHYWVALEHDTLWGDQLIPLTVLVGNEARPGEGLVALGATHGNEYEGPIAIKHFAAELDESQARGRLILIPVLNPAAFRAGTRDSVNDDGVNLNRAFVSGAGHTPGIAGITHRIAAFVRRVIWPHVHVVIDLHSGGRAAQFLLCMSFHDIEDLARTALSVETARLFGTPIIMIYQNETPGLLTSEAERLGKLTLGSELGWGEAVNPDGVHFARTGLRAAAIRHRQIRGELQLPVGPQARLVSIADRRSVSVSPFAGHWEPFHRPGAEVREGDTLGLLHDFDRFDLPPWEVRAGRSGLLVFQAWDSPVMQGQHIAGVGTTEISA